MHILIFDSGLGGLTVHAEVRKARPDVRYTYLADDSVFPYGRLAPGVLVDRVMQVIGAAMERDPADMIVIACHTASTLVLPPLRSCYTIPIIGTVPAIKPAAEMTVSRFVSVLATPGTVERDYTRDLVATFAGHCEVTLVGCRDLATLAEAHLRGETVADADIVAEIESAFVEKDSRLTDTIVLACTHYPILLDRLKKLAPWPVAWIDPAPAIARRVLQLAGAAPDDSEDAGVGRAIFTSGKPPRPALAAALRERYLTA